MILMFVQELRSYEDVPEMLDESFILAPPDARVDRS